MPLNVGFVGLGQMGKPIALNLLASGHGVRAFNRTSGKSEHLTAAGAVEVQSIEETATAGGVVLSMVSDDDALRAVCTDGLLSRLGAGGVHVSMSTVSPALVASLTEQHKRHGVDYVAAPVFGRPEAAAARKLWVVVAGAAEAKHRVVPLLNAIGQGVYDVGQNPEAASVLKVAGNFLAYAAVEAMAEAAILVEKHGLGRALLLEMLTQTLFASPVYQNFGKRIIDADFERAGFAADLGLKDMSLAHDAAALSGTHLPLLELLIQRFETAITNGNGSADATIIARTAAADAGLTW